MPVSTAGATPARPVTVRDIAEKRSSGGRIVAVTAYDALFGRLVDESGVDLILVGDSVANIVGGYESTLPVTLDQIIYHAGAVRRGVKHALIVVDMPFLTYQASVETAVLNCGRVLQETAAGAVKMEGAHPEMLRTVEAVVRAGIPVVGHLGFTPQSVNTMSGARVQGRSGEDAERILQEAAGLESAGAFAIVLELIPSALAKRITESVAIPTIGIGAGPHCTGQVLVLHDLLGLNDGFAPKFLKRYANLATEVRRAVTEWGSDVRNGAYPDDAHSF